MNNKIFLIHSETEFFNDRQHLLNFIKYLFSQSKQHQPNSLTPLNFYFKYNSITKKHVFNFLDEPQKKYNIFLKTNDNTLDNYENIYNDLMYPVFFIQLDGLLYTNLLIINENNLSVSYPENLFQIIIDEYFGGIEDEFYDLVNKLIKQDVKVVEFSNATKEHREKIEILIHKELIKNQSSNLELLIQISHHDQSEHSLYHIHRLLKDK